MPRPDPVRLILLVLTVWLFTGCQALPRSLAPAHRGADVVHVTLLHMNDVYEIVPLDGGRSGGLARVATLRQRLVERNPNSLLLLGGDVFSPSAIGIAKVDGHRLAGRPMLSVLNAVGVDYATFGNHEFDLKRGELLEYLADSRFEWVSSNVTDPEGHAMPGVVRDEIVTFENAAGERFRLGMFGLTLDSNRADYVRYADPVESARKAIRRLESKGVDFIIALTHQAIEDDEALLERFPAIDLVLGGHEHDNFQRWRGGGRLRPILKADANARSLYRVDLYFDASTGEVRVETAIVPVDERIPLDPSVDEVVRSWMGVAFDAYRRQGLDPARVVARTDLPLDGRSKVVRASANGLTSLIADSMRRAYAQADLSVFNSGSIRIDDIVPPGELTFYDLIRILPYGGQVALVEIDGALLAEILEQGVRNRGTGGFLQWSGVERTADGWRIAGRALSTDRRYTVAMMDFLLTGRETGLDYLTPDHPGLKVVDPGQGTDIRRLLAKELSERTGRSSASRPRP